MLMKHWFAATARAAAPPYGRGTVAASVHRLPLKEQTVARP